MQRQCGRFAGFGLFGAKLKNRDYRVQMQIAPTHVLKFFSPQAGECGESIFKPARRRAGCEQFGQLVFGQRTASTPLDSLLYVATFQSGQGIRQQPIRDAPIEKRFDAREILIGVGNRFALSLQRR